MAHAIAQSKPQPLQEQKINAQEQKLNRADTTRIYSLAFSHFSFGLNDSFHQPVEILESVHTNYFSQLLLPSGSKEKEGREINNLLEWIHYTSEIAGKGIADQEIQSYHLNPTTSGKPSFSSKMFYGYLWAWKSDGSFYKQHRFLYKLPTTAANESELEAALARRAQDESNFLKKSFKQVERSNDQYYLTDSPVESSYLLPSILNTNLVLPSELISIIFDYTLVDLNFFIWDYNTNPHKASQFSHIKISHF